MPAIKAPSARLKPVNSVSQANPRVINNRLSTNSSSLLRRATTVSQNRITRGPPTSSKVIRTVALAVAMASVSNNCSPEAPKAGISTNKGTTAKS